MWLLRPGTVLVLSLLAGACTKKYAVSGTAETFTTFCGKPPYRTPVRVVHVYRGGMHGASVSGRPYLTAGATKGRFSARLPAGRYCLSTGGTAPVCDTELELPGPPGSARTIFISRTIHPRETCTYD